MFPVQQGSPGRRPRYGQRRGGKGAAHTASRSESHRRCGSCRLARVRRPWLQVCSVLLGRQVSASSQPEEMKAVHVKEPGWADRESARSLRVSEAEKLMRKCVGR